MTTDDRIPTSGKAVINAGGSSGWIRFYDEPLTKDEEAAVAWFTELSPHEQLREVRRLKFNLEQTRSDRDAWKARCRDESARADRMELQCASRRPDGFEFPRAMASLRDHAIANGWDTAVAWFVEGAGAVATLDFHIRSGGWLFRLRWDVPIDGNGSGSMDRLGLARSPRRDWHDAPSLKRIREIIIDAGRDN